MRFQWLQALHNLRPDESVGGAFHLISLLVCQIAPADSPDVTERMVIITGTPEAQFKVKTEYVQEYLFKTIIFCGEMNFVNSSHNSSGSLCVPIFPSLSLPHTLLCIPGPRSDIWEAERGELLLGEGGGQTGDAHQGSLECSWQGHRQRGQDGKRVLELF